MRILTIILAAAALGGSALGAGMETLTVRFASPVQVGGKVLPAGEIQFNITHGTSSVILTVRAENGDAAMAVVSRAAETELAGNPNVVLGRSGGVLKVERICLADGSAYAITNAQ